MKKNILHTIVIAVGVPLVAAWFLFVMSFLEWFMHFLGRTFLL